ncbi:indole-3-acetic acid-amido synthetase GH3.10-like [Salvia divinorum]|uniref:Indole-3-acetic acid-amido synthetase GH3.10-like n=1 Tax=Salvia divinorum TaxID=28513 RepID=A0ABD1HW53_SALDI
MSCRESDIIGWFDAAAESAAAQQTETLRRILWRNHTAEYLKKWLGDVDVHHLEASALESLFTSSMPLASHADLEPYIRRIADGETTPLLTQEPIATLSLSSGTTEGRPKYVPFTRHSSETTLQIFKLAAAYRSRMYPTKEKGRVLEFIYSSKRFKTKCGITVGTATTHVYASEEFKMKQHETKSYTCSPQEVISSGDYKQSTYCHLLLGIHYAEEVEYVTSTFAYSVVQAFRSFQEAWREICNDIRDGTLSSTKVTIPDVRRAVLEVLRPNPGLALKIEAKCHELERRDWVGLIPELWPNAKYVYSIMTGSMQPYLSKLSHYAGNLALISADYGSTESWIGVNMEPCLPPDKVTFAVIPTFSYFEFIPLRRQSHDTSDYQATDDFVEGDPVPLSQVKMGNEYEIVLTTFTGLYRYRLGDVVEVAGFHRNTPKLNFICRRKLILTVNIDKNTEKDLQSVVARGSQILRNTGAELVDFTSHADVGKQPGHYIIYWEIEGKVEERLLEDCCREMDAAFVDQGYIVSRKSNSIGPLELCIVEKGTFKKIMENFIANGAALSQFKTPRCTSNPVLLKILNVCTIKKFHSTAYAS